jgi:iron complex transport system substrate-binding protein
MKAWLALLVAWLLAACAQAQGIELIDARGKVVRLATPPQRIVSLLPSVTESVCALGACARLVGVDRYSNHPASVRALPQVGGGVDPQIESIVALRPDAVLLATSSRAAERLEALGLKVLAIEPKTHADVRRTLGQLAQVLGLPPAAADAQWRTIDAAVSAAAQSLPARARGARVYFEVSRGPYAAGQVSFIGETMARLGLANVVPASLGPFPRLNPEFVLRADPDLILIGSRGMQDAIAYPGWATLRAVREQRVCQFGPDEADVLVRPGPRMAEAARLMAACAERVLR